MQSIESCSQSSQDLFVLCILKHKRNGYFIEIGTNEPIHYNNTYILESKYGWKGLLVEYEKDFEYKYIQQRKSKYIINDARNIDYRKFLEDNNFPTSLDYLQIDLDVNNRSTLDTLERLNDTVFDKYKFATVTFEHDIYQGNHFDTREKSRKIFADKGYVMVFADVRHNVPYEDWYVHPDLVDMKWVNKIKSDPIVLTAAGAPGLGFESNKSLLHAEIREILLKNIN